MGSLRCTVFHVATKDRVRAIREALGLTQEELAERTLRLERVEVQKIESGKNKATTDRVRAGLATAFGVTRDTVALYLDEAISFDEMMRRISEARSPDPEHVTLPDLPDGVELTASERLHVKAAMSVGVQPETVREYFSHTFDSSKSRPTPERIYGDLRKAQVMRDVGAVGGELITDATSREVFAEPAELVKKKQRKG